MKVSVHSLAVVIQYASVAVFGILTIVIALTAYDAEIISFTSTNLPNTISELVYCLLSMTNVDVNHSLNFQINTDSEPVGSLSFLSSFIISSIAMAVAPMAFAALKIMSARRAAILLFIYSVLIVLSYTFIYKIGGIHQNGKIITNPSFGQSLFLSMTMMSSLGFGDIVGHSSVRHYIAFQALIGYFTLGASLGLLINLTFGSRLTHPSTETRDCKPQTVPNIVLGKKPGR